MRYVYSNIYSIADNIRLYAGTEKEGVCSQNHGNEIAQTDCVFH